MDVFYDIGFAVVRRRRQLFQQQDNTGGAGSDRRTAFSRGSGGAGGDSSGGSNSTSQGAGTTVAGGNDTGGNGHSDTGTGHAASSNGDVPAGGSVQDGSNGDSGDTEAARRAERARQRREQRAAKKLEQQRTADSTSDANEKKHVGGDTNDFVITVESGASPLTPTQDDKQQRKAERAKPGSRKYKEPPKDTVNVVASSLRDVYDVIDTLVDAGMTLSGYEYPKGTMQLDEHTSNKLARSLAQMNSALPKMAERVNKVSAPLTLFSTFAMDLAMKGMIIYGVVQSKKANQHHHVAPVGQSRIANVATVDQASIPESSQVDARIRPASAHIWPVS